MAFIYKLKVEILFRLNKEGIRRDSDCNVVISLTSYPKRFNLLHLTIKSLLIQNLKAGKLILWVSCSDKDKLPENVKRLQNNGLEIKYCNDFKSYKKILPTCLEFSHSYIVTADDDVYYPSNWLEDLLDGAAANPNSVIAHRAHIVTLGKGGRPNKYSEWIFDAKLSQPSYRIFPTGVGGVLYPPGSLNNALMDYDLIKTMCPYADDIWLYWITKVNKVPSYVIQKRFKIIQWEVEQEESLSVKNVIHGGNDEQIDRVIEKFGYEFLSNA